MVHPRLALSLAAAASTVLAAQKPDDISADVVPGAYIIEFETNTAIDQFRVQNEPDYELRMQLDFELFSGISIQFHNVSSAEEKTAQLSSLPAIKNIWPVTLLQRAEPRDEAAPKDGNLTESSGIPKSSRLIRRSNDNSAGNSPHVVTQVDQLHARGITGKGIKIAIVDDGVDYHHPDLGGCFGKGCLVSHGYDLVGDEYDGSNTPIPDDDPDDTCGWTGTALAGIIAAGENRYGFTGVAPGANLAAYRVFGCAGSTTVDVVMAAFHRAYDEGAHIITTSLTSPNGWANEPFAAAVSRIVDKGVPCILGVGDKGRGLFDTSSAAGGRGVTAVATFFHTHRATTYPEGYYRIGNGNLTAFPWQWADPSSFDGAEYPLWVTGYDVHNNNDACEPLPDDTPNLADFHVLIRRGDCDYLTQAINVAAKGARFFMVYNNRPGLENFAVDRHEGTASLLGAAMVPQDIGEAWVRALENGSTVKATLKYWEDSSSFVVYEPDDIKGGVIDPWSSWGPTYEMNFKPQFGAPGSYIVSTAPLEQGSYALRWGSYMAAAFVAGAYALVAEARGIKPEPALFENILASTAKPQPYYWYHLGRTDWVAPAAAQGAGLIQVYDASFSRTYLEPSSLSFNDTDHFVRTLSFTITNENKNDASYEISHTPSHTFYIFREWLSEPEEIPGDDTPSPAQLSFSKSKVSLAPGDSITIEVAATPPTDVANTRYPYWSGYIAVNGSDGSSLSIPYQGLTGSLHDVPVARNFALVTNSACHPNHSPSIKPNTTFLLPHPGEYVDYTEVSLPRITLKMAWGSTRATAEVVKVSSCRRDPTQVEETIGQAYGFPLTFVARGSRLWYWRGQLENGDFVRPGTYKIVSKYLRIFGDESKEGDWMVAETVPIKIRYAEPGTDPSDYPRLPCW